MSNAFSSPKAFDSFDELFKTECQSRKNAYIPRVWQAKAESGDEDITQHFPLLENASSGEPWVLDSLSLSDLKGFLGVKEHTSTSQSSHTYFVTVSNFFFLKGCKILNIPDTALGEHATINHCRDLSRPRPFRFFTEHESI